MDTVIVIQYKELERLPPTMMLLQTLRSLGREVVYIGTYSQAGDIFLRDSGIEYYFMPDFTESINRGKTILAKVWRRVKRLHAFIVQRHWIRKTLARLILEKSDMTIWFSEVASAALVGDWGLRFGKRLMTIYEMFDFKGEHWCGFKLRRHISTAKLIVPEYNRSYILQGFLDLRERPMVIPNKPFVHPRIVNLPLPGGRVKDVFDAIGNRPVFLYQGVWTQDRADVTRFAEIIARNRPNYCLVFLPECEQAKQLERKYKNVFSLPFISAPNHLAVTSHATVGLAIYNIWGRTPLTRLNVAYCAPNKIYEYAGFGIPTLGNKIPGLVYTIDHYSAGICCDFDEESILKAADALVTNNSHYREGAKKMYESIDLMDAVRGALASAELGEVN